MKILAAAAAVGAALSPASGLAASIDLSAFGLAKGDVIAQSDEATVSFLPDSGVDEASVDDGTFFAFFSFLIGDPFPGALDVLAPVSFSGDLLAQEIGANSAIGLFFDGTDYLVAMLEVPHFAFYIHGDGFEGLGATATLCDTESLAPIPLPAAASLLLAGLGAIAVAGRRRAAEAHASV